MQLVEHEYQTDDVIYFSFGSFTSSKKISTFTLFHCPFGESVVYYL